MVRSLPPALLPTTTPLNCVSVVMSNCMASTRHHWAILSSSAHLGYADITQPSTSDKENSHSYQTIVAIAVPIMARQSPCTVNPSPYSQSRTCIPSQLNQPNPLNLPSHQPNQHKVYEGVPLSH